MTRAPRVLDPSAAITIRGARVHNLQGIDLDLPRDRLVVFTGVSGSGKSSLAFDTIFAEGQRRYIECLSSYARQFLDQLQRPDVDLIEGLPPTVAIDQKAGQASPRSTVGTITEIHDYLRLLFARLGTPFCPRCGLPIHRQTPEQMAAHVLAFPQGRRVMILAPLRARTQRTAPRGLPGDPPRGADPCPSGRRNCRGNRTASQACQDQDPSYRGGH